MLRTLTPFSWRAFPISPACKVKHPKWHTMFAHLFPALPSLSYHPNCCCCCNQVLRRCSQKVIYYYLYFSFSSSNRVLLKKKSHFSLQDFQQGGKSQPTKLDLQQTAFRLFRGILPVFSSSSICVGVLPTHKERGKKTKQVVCQLQPTDGNTSVQPSGFFVTPPSACPRFEQFCTVPALWHQTAFVTHCTV